MPNRPENTAPFANFSPNVSLPSTWKSQTNISHIWMPNPENSQSSFPLDVNVTVFSENFNQNAMAYIIINITISNNLVNSLNVRALMFNIAVANASRVNSTAEDLEPPTGPFYMIAWQEANIYFPNRTASALIPYDWFASDYITFHDTGAIKLNLQYGLNPGENTTLTTDWMQRNFMNVTLNVPIDILPYGTVYIEPTLPFKSFLGLFNIVDKNNYAYSALWSVVPIAFTAYYFLLDYYKTTNAPRKNKRFFSFPSWVMLAILGAAYAYKPYDWNWISLQAEEVILIAAIGCVFIWLNSEKMVIFFFRKKKGYKVHNRKSH